MTRKKIVAKELATSGGFVAPVNLTDRDWERLNTILGRDLTEDERDLIAANVARFASMASIGGAKTQAIKRDLKSFALLPDREVLDVLGLGYGKPPPAPKCLRETRVLIEDTLVRMRLPFAGNSPATYIAAALLASQNMPNGKDGKRIKGYRPALMMYAVRLWQSLGRNNLRVSESEGNATPLVRFAAAILALVEVDGSPTYSVVAKALRKAKKVIA